MNANVIGDRLLRAEQVRQKAILMTTFEKRASFSQFLTPKETASLAASFFSISKQSTPLQVLDLGAGTGILSIATAARYLSNVEITALEIDPLLSNICAGELKNNGIKGVVKTGDALAQDFQPIFDRVILNPPYKKMAADDPRQTGLPAPSPNLYAAFVMRGVSALKDGGELVAIIPRSWMNGAYFQPFRTWLLNHVSVDVIHVYESRTEVFKDTDVLQETMILKVSKKPQNRKINLSSSKDKSDVPVVEEFLTNDLVSGCDFVIRVTPHPASSRRKTLRELGFCASTGKVIDFRVKEFLRDHEEEKASKLFYPHNFVEDSCIHPVAGKKPQWILSPGKTLIPAGCYVIVKRFSPKEDAKRIKAYFAKFSEPVALENHLNFIHAGTPRMVVPLDESVARSILSRLQSPEIEEWFIGRSGSTQVNASDLNEVPFPDDLILTMPVQSGVLL